MATDNPPESRDHAWSGFLLHEVVDKLLAEGEFSPADKLLHGLFFLFGAAFFAAISYVLYLFAKHGLIAAGLVVFVPLAGVCGLIAVVKLLEGFLEKAYRFDCPVCGTRTAISHTLRVRPCRQCFHIIHLAGNMDNATSFTATCPHCGSAIHLYAGDGELACLNCGSNLRIDSHAQILHVIGFNSDPCVCGAKLPAGAFACRRCCRIMRGVRIPEIDDICRVSLSPWGHLIWAWRRAESVATDITSVDSKSPQAATVFELIERMGAIMLSLEAAASKEEYGRHVLFILRRLQAHYAFLLAALIKVFAAKSSWVFPKKAMPAIPAAAQNKVVGRLAIQSSGVYRWSEGVLTFVDEIEKGSTTGRCILTSYDKLLSEAKRLSEPSERESPVELT